jgi:hypothetical protein
LTASTRLAPHRNRWLRILGVAFVMYVLSYIDRTNIAMAKLKMLGDTGMTEYAYGLGAGLFFYVGYFIFEVPSNLIMERVGARIWLARIMISWGIISTSMMFVGGATSFYVNDSGAQELVYSTGAETMDMSTAGLYVNMIPKDGGNTFSGSAFFGGTGSGLQSNNLTDELVGQGLTSVNGVRRVYDYNGATYDAKTGQVISGTPQPNTAANATPPSSTVAICFSSVPRPKAA